MAFKTRTVHRLKCEECFTHFPTSRDHEARIKASSKHSTVGRAVADGWTVRGSKHYCPDHGDAVVDTEPEEDALTINAPGGSLGDSGYAEDADDDE